MPPPYKIVTDIPSEAPRLGFEDLAGNLADLISTSRPQFAVGIFGGWGSGKTTLMNTIRRQLDQNPDVITVDFSAWRYEKEEHLIVPLLDVIRARMLEWSEGQTPAVQAIAVKTASTIGKVIRALLAGMTLKVGIPEALDVSFDANKAMAKAAEIGQENREETIPQSFYQGCFLALRKIFHQFREAKMNARIVVFVDDLDRCLPDGALGVLESMKLFFDLEGFVFVVGLDNQIVSSAIEAKYGRVQPGSSTRNVSGSEYIKKIFSVPYSLPRVRAADLDDFLPGLCEEASFDDGQKDELSRLARPHLEYLVNEGGINPREVKRFVNAYILQQNLRPDLQPDLLLAFTLMTFREDWRAVQEAFQLHQHELFEALRNNDTQALRDLEPDLQIPPRFMTYISDGEPGWPMLNGHAYNLDDYMKSAETSLRRDTEFMELKKAMGRLRSRLRAWESNPAQSVDVPSAAEEVESMLRSSRLSKGMTGVQILEVLQRIQGLVSEGSVPPARIQALSAEFNPFIGEVARLMD